MKSIPLILDSFEEVQVGKREGGYNPDTQVWEGDSKDLAEQVESRQTHHRGEDH